MCAQHPVTYPVKKRPENDYLLVETCSLHITLCNKNSCADVQISNYSFTVFVSFPSTSTQMMVQASLLLKTPRVTYLQLIYLVYDSGRMLGMCRFQILAAMSCYFLTFC